MNLLRPIPVDGTIYQDSFMTRSQEGTKQRNYPRSHMVYTVQRCTMSQLLIIIKNSELFRPTRLLRRETPQTPRCTNSIPVPLNNSPGRKWKCAQIIGFSTQNTVLLPRTHYLGVHSHEVVVDSILLLLGGFLLRRLLVKITPIAS